MFSEIKRQIGLFNRGVEKCRSLFLSFFFVTVLIAGFCFPCDGQIDVKRLSVEKGLSSRRVWDLAIDNRGFMWVATDNGLNRFDGSEFVLLNLYSENAYLSTNKGVRRCFWLETESELLIAQKNNVCLERFNPREGRARTLRLVPGNGQKGNYYGEVVEKEGWPVFLTRDTGVYYFHEYKQGRFLNKETIVTPLKVSDFIWSDTLIWLNSELGVAVFDRRNRNLTIYDHSSLPEGNRAALQESPLRVSIVKDGSTYAFKGFPGLYSLDLENGNFQLLDNGRSDLLYLYFASDSYGNEIIIYKDSIHQSSVFLQLIIREHGQEEHFITRIEDQIHFSGIKGSRFSDHIWLPTNNGILHLQIRKVKTYLDSNSESNQIFNISGLNGDSLLIISDLQGWSLFDPYQNEFLPFEHWPNSWEYPGTTNIRINSNGHLWGIYNGKLIWGDPQQRLIREITPPNPITALTLDERGYPWVTTYLFHEKSGLFFYDPEKQEFNRWYDEEGVDPLEYSHANRLHFSNFGILWVGTDEGLLLVDTENANFRKYPGPGALPNGHRSFSFTEIIETASGQFWLGTSNAGLLWFDATTLKWKQWMIREGLCDSHIISIVPDEKRNLWLSTMNGISYFDVGKEIFHNFYEQDGLSQNTFSPHTGYRTKTGRIFFGGINGMDIFNPEDLLSLDISAKMEVARLVFFDRRLKKLVSDLYFEPESQSVVLPPNHRYFEIHLALSNLRDPEKGRFTYFLEDFHDEWQQSGSENILTFPYLPAGRYRLHVKGAARSSNWSDPVTIKIVVRNFFYRTWWFYLICFLIGGMVFYWIRRLKKQQAIRMQNLRTDIAGDVHDEIGNSLVHLQHLLRDSKLETGKPAGTRALNVLQNTLESSRDIVWAIDSRNDAIENLVDRMKDFLIKTVKPSGIQYAFTSENLRSDIPFNSFFRHHTYLLFKEAVTNVIKHSEASKVAITLKIRRNWFWKLELVIQDNGKGIENLLIASDGNGLRSMYRRAKKLNGQLFIDTQPGKGVFIKLTCSLPREKHPT